MEIIRQSGFSEFEFIKQKGKFVQSRNNLILISLANTKIPDIETKPQQSCQAQNRQMNQQILSTYSIVVIKHIQKEETYVLRNQSFIRSEIFLSKNSSSKQFQNSLFYVQIDGNSREFNQQIEFEQKVMFRHKITNKYLAFSEEFEEEQNDTTYRLELSEKKCFFKLCPCFQYQTKISSKIKFNQDVYLTSEINTAKLGYISTRQMDKTQVGQNLKRTVLGLNYKSKFILHNYYELEKQQTNYTFGSIIWLTHIECANFLAVKMDVQKGQHERKQSKQRKQGKQFNQEANVLFQNLEVDRDMQSSEGLWLLESDNYQTGGKLHFQQKFMLKNLCSGSYLSFLKIQKPPSKQVTYSFILSETPSKYSKFIFKSLKGEDNRIKKGSYLILKNQQSLAYVGCRKSKLKDVSKLTRPTIDMDFSDEDLFKIIELSEEESEAIRFIFNVREELKYISSVLAGKASKQKGEVMEARVKPTPGQSHNQFWQIYSLYDNMKKQLVRLQKFDKLYQQVQLELIRFIDQFTAHIRAFRSKHADRKGSHTSVKQSELIQTTLKTLYELLIKTCHQNRSNQTTLYRYIHHFIDDFFFDVGAEDLMTTIFANNYSLLCRVPDPLPALQNLNIVRTIIKCIAKASVTKNQRYWLNIEKIMKLFMTFIYLNKTTIDINQRLISEELFQNNKTFDNIFFAIRITSQRIKVEATQPQDPKSLLLNPLNALNPLSTKPQDASQNTKTSKATLIDLEQIKDPLIIKILQGLFELLWSLCANRNFISKKAIDKYLNEKNKQGPSILINYLTIPISKKLLNNLYGLITNLYIDSCPRINRYRPLSVINFVFSANEQVSRSEQQQAEITSRLNQHLLSNVQQSYRSRPLFISNLLSLTQNFEPTLTSEQLDAYKDQISHKIADNNWSVELLNSMAILMSLESYTVHQIIQIFNLMTKKLIHSDKDENLATDITIGIMDIYDQILTYNIQLEMKKMTTYLKHKFNKRQHDLQNYDIDHLLPQAKRFNSLFHKKNQTQHQQKYLSTKIDPSPTVAPSPTLQQYNSMHDTLERLSPTMGLKQHLFDLFVATVTAAQGQQNNDQTSKLTNRSSSSAIESLFSQNPMLKVLGSSQLLSPSRNKQYLKSIHKTFLQFNQPKLYFLKVLMNSIVITKDEAPTFEFLFQKYKTLKHLISISEYWLCNSQQGYENDDTDKFYGSIDSVVSYFYDGHTFEVKVSFKKDYTNINVNRQLLIKNLGFHVTVLELLETNFYLLEKKEKKQMSKKHVNVFEKCFEFLNHFIYECKENKELIHAYWHVLNKFRDLVEVGQTTLYIELLKNQKDYTRQVKPILVEKIIHKIIKPLEQSVGQQANGMSVANKMSVSTLNGQCEFNPEYLRFLHTICVVDGDCYKPNLELVYKFIEKDHVFRRIFFAQQDKQTGKFKFCLEPHQIKQDPVQVPFLYHAKILKLMNLFIAQLESVSTSLKNRIEAMFPVEYLMALMSEPDIYSHTGPKAEMNFLLKKQTTQLCTSMLEKSDKLPTLASSPQLQKLLSFTISTFIDRNQRTFLPLQLTKLYQPFLQKQHHDIQYFTNNQRSYYTDYIKPFLLKLKSMLEKVSNYAGSKNYQLVVHLLNSVKIEKLSHDIDAKKFRYNIEAVNFKWKNFVDKDLENSKEEKFAKRTVLQILRNPHTVSALQQEKSVFFKLIKQFSSHHYIKAIKVLLQLLMQEQLTENESEQTIIDIYQILQTLQEFFSSLTPQEVDEMTPTFEECKFIEHLIDYCNSSNFDYNKLLYKKILNRILKIFNVIMLNDQQCKVHKMFYKYFQQNLLSYRFFKLLNNTISQIGERVEGERFFDQVNNALNSLYLCVEEKRMNLDQEGLKFLSHLCNYNPFTAFLRFQTLYPSIDFLQKVYNALVFIMFQQQQQVKINVIVVDTAQQILRCISSFLTGGNKINQSYIIDNKFPEILNQVLRMESIKEPQHQGQVNQRNRLLEEVIQFYDSNGIEIGKLINNKIKIIDFRDIYVLNRIKQALLRTLTECVTGNERAFSKIKIQIPIEFLKINLIWIYEDFIKSKQDFKESIILRKKQTWDMVVQQQRPNSLFLMIGFYFYMLIENYNMMEKEKQQDQDDMADDKEKNKQKVVKKFFSSISDKEKKQDQMKSLQKEPFAQQMKQFYEKYYEALQFFGRYSLTIEVNLLGSLARVYFPKIPICQKLTEPMIDKFKQQADRVSQDQKIKSLLQFSQKIYDQLAGQEEFFMYYEQNYPYLAIFLKSMKYESEFLFIAWILAVCQTVFFLIQDYTLPVPDCWEFTSTMLIIPKDIITTLIFVISIFNLYLAFILTIYIFARRVPVIRKLLHKKFVEEGIDEGLWANQWLYVGVGTFSQISYIVFVIFCLIATFIHPMFAGFLLTEILNRIEIGKQITRSIRQTWTQLLVAVCLLIIINLFYSMFIYVVYYQPYGPTCKSFFQCMLFLIDSSLKSGQGFLGQQGAALYPDAVTDQSNPNIRFFCQVLYVVFAQQVVFQIFSGTIIDKFSQLRQESVDIAQDQESNCYICGLERFDIDFEYEGFETHTEKNHNKINYIFYLFYLKRLNRQNYGIVQKYIEQCQLKNKKDWIPDNNSIFKEQKEKAEQREEEEENDERVQQKFYIKKSQQLKKVRESTATYVQDLRNQVQM